MPQRILAERGPGKRAAAADEVELPYYQQHFTPDNAVDRLYQGLNITPVSIADFSAGDGRLLLPALKQWPDANTYAVEIDEKLSERLRATVPNSNIAIGSAYSSDTLRNIDLEPNSVDLVVGNPPFQKEKLTQNLVEIIRPIYQRSPNGRRTIPSVFLHLCLAHYYLRPNGLASFIVPKNFLHGASFHYLRSQIENAFSVLSVGSLSDSLFKSADVKTYQILLKKEKNTGLTFDQAMHTLPCTSDARSHATEPTSELKLSDFKPRIARGNLPARYGRLRQALHISHLPRHPQTIKINDIVITNANHRSSIYAEKNDILISRVGTRSVGRIALIAAGSAPITDCVFRLRFKELSNKQISGLFARMARADIPSQALATSTGSCAAYLTINQLMNLRL